jgi:hypothetical protein
LRRSLAIPGLALAASLSASASTPLDCPPGARPDAVEKPGKPLTVEFCKDAVTGLREGPMRVTRRDGFTEAAGHYRAGKLDGEYLIFGNDGRAELRLVYAEGRQLEERFTRLGLDRQIARINANAQAARKHWRMSLIDDRTVAYTVRIGAPFSWVPADESGLRARLIEERAVCPLFDWPADIEHVFVRYENGDGKELARLTISRADCGSTGAGRGS